MYIYRFSKSIKHPNEDIRYLIRFWIDFEYDAKITVSRIVKT